MNPSALSATPGAPSPSATAPAWRRSFLLLAAAGLAWNLFGLSRLIGTLNASPETLMGGGLSAAQAAAYLALPAWMTAAFAGGVLGGLAGSAGLLLRRAWALPVLAASLVCYVALFAGDAYHGLFEVMPKQLPVLIVVLAVAALLLAGAAAARRTGWLR